MSATPRWADGSRCSEPRRVLGETDHGTRFLSVTSHVKLRWRRPELTVLSVDTRWSALVRVNVMVSALTFGQLAVVIELRVDEVARCR